MARLINADEIIYWHPASEEGIILGRRFAYKYEIDQMPEVEAIPVEWIKERINTLNEYINRFGGITEQEAVVNAKIHAVGELVRMIADWRVENGQTD